MKMNLFLQEITFITEFPGSNFLLLRFLTGGKWDFQVEDLLLATLSLIDTQYFSSVYLCDASILVDKRSTDESCSGPLQPNRDLLRTCHVLFLSLAYLEVKMAGN